MALGKCSGRDMALGLMQQCLLHGPHYVCVAGGEPMQRCLLHGPHYVCVAERELMLLPPLSFLLSAMFAAQATQRVCGRRRVDAAMFAARAALKLKDVLAGERVKETRVS